MANTWNAWANWYSTHQPTVPGTEYPLLSKRHIPGWEYPLLSKRHIPGFFGNGSKERNWDLEGDWAKIKRRFWDPTGEPGPRGQLRLGGVPFTEPPYPGSLRDWLGQLIQQWLSNYPRLPQSPIPTPTVEYPAAPLKDWLSNYPRLPQSTIPSPAVEYPAPGRPPEYRKPLPWKQPGYTNPFAWRRKNNGWW